MSDMSASLSCRSPLSNPKRTTPPDPCWRGGMVRACQFFLITACGMVVGMNLLAGGQVSATAGPIRWRQRQLNSAIRLAHLGIQPGTVCCLRLNSRSSKSKATRELRVNYFKASRLFHRPCPRPFVALDQSQAQCPRDLPLRTSASCAHRRYAGRTG